VIDLAFYGATGVAVFATFMTVANPNPVHALLYLIVSLLAAAVLFFLLGAPFAAMLEVIVYAGAIMVLFVFVVMMLNLGSAAVEKEQLLLSPSTWAGPAVLCVLLMAEVGYLIWHAEPHALLRIEVGAKQTAIALYGPYLLAVELASMLLLGGLVAAYHLGRRE
jgi:NADH-quinone oxidoreductase subunit J